jgi:hypothetical protein
MKLLLVDFARRLWGLYLLTFLMLSMIEAGLMEAGPHARGEFLLVGLFTVPWWLDLARGPTSVTATLPLSRKTLGLFYFVLAVCVPVILLMLGIAIATQVFNPSIIFSWTDFVFVAFAALVVAGAICLLLSFLLAKVVVEEGSHSLLLTGFWVVWWPAIWGGMMYHSKLETICRGPWAWIGLISLGLPVTAWAFIRSEKLIIGRARNRSSSVPKARKAILPARPSAVRLSGPFGLIAERIRGGFVAAVILALLVVFYKWNTEQDVTWIWMGLLMGGIPIFGGLRLLRTLPLSTNQLALWLLLMPLCTLAPVFLVFAAVPVFSPGSFSPPRVASLLFLAIATSSLANGFGIRFGFAGGYTCVMLLGLCGMVVAHSVPIAGIPAVVGWLLGMALYCVGFFLIRHALCSSDSYQARKETIFS